MVLEHMPLNDQIWANEKHNYGHGVGFRVTFYYFSDPEQLEVASLCDGVVRFLQELPGPVVPPALQMDMVNAVKG